MKIINLEQRSDDWHAFRKEGIGASESAKILGLSKYGNAKSVYNDKLGNSKTFINEHIVRGMELEDTILELSEAALDKSLYPVCGIHDEYDFIRASFDGLSSDYKIVVECKAPQKMPPVSLLQDIKTNFPDYWCQVQHQLLVSGAIEGYLAFYAKEEFKLMQITRDNEFINNTLIPGLKEFWDKFQSGASEQDIEGLLYIDEQKAIEKAERLAKVMKKKKRYEAEEKLLRDELAEYGDDGDLAFGNILTMKRVGGKTVNYRKACEDAGLELKPYTKERIGSYRVKILEE